MVPDDPIYKEFQWDLRKIGMEAVWDVTTGSPDVIVAVLDTGVDEAHPDLEPNILDGYDFVNDDPDAWDDSSHGTHVAGVIAALGNNGEGTAGIAWKTKILPIKVLDAKGLGPDAGRLQGDHLRRREQGSDHQPLVGHASTSHACWRRLPASPSVAA